MKKVILTFVRRLAGEKDFRLVCRSFSIVIYIYIVIVRLVQKEKFISFYLLLIE